MHDGPIYVWISEQNQKLIWLTGEFPETSHTTK